MYLKSTRWACEQRIIRNCFHSFWKKVKPYVLRTPCICQILNRKSTKTLISTVANYWQVTNKNKTYTFMEKPERNTIGVCGRRSLNLLGRSRFVCLCVRFCVSPSLTIMRTLIGRRPSLGNQKTTRPHPGQRSPPAPPFLGE